MIRLNTYMPSAPGKLAISRRTWLASASSMATRLTRYFVCSPHARACGQPLAFGKLGVLFVDSSEIIVALPTIEPFVSDEGTPLPPGRTTRPALSVPCVCVWPCPTPIEKRSGHNIIGVARRSLVPG